MKDREENRDNVIHERPSVLLEQGYRGFQLNKISREWDEFHVSASNPKGHVVSSTGETKEEAYQNLISAIDRYND